MIIANFLYMKLFHVHIYHLRANADEMWLECRCSHREKVPNDKEWLAYEMLVNGSTYWGLNP